jgi:MoxR-like ATPase
VGKTELVQTLAERKGASLYDLRLTTIEPQDLRGLPFYDHEKGRTVWYRPEDLPDDPDRPAILFLDELTAAAPTLQPTVYGLLQERRVGRHRLPDSVFIVAAGNMVEDGAIAYEMGTALSDRLIHVIVQADADDWLKSYAPGAGIHPPSPPSCAGVPTCWRRPRTRFAGATPSPAPRAAGPGSARSCRPCPTAPRAR